MTAAQRRHSPTVAPSALSIQVDTALVVGSQAPPPTDQSATPRVATDVQIEREAPWILQTDPRADDQSRVEGLTDVATRENVDPFDFADSESDHSDHFLYDQLSEQHRTDHTAPSGI